MIKNIVFDFGQVLVHFDPAYMVRQYVTAEPDATMLETVVFDRLYWDRLDAGTITDEEVVTAVKARLPHHLHEDAARIYYHWIRHIPPVAGMGALIKKLKRAGRRMYLLSNISTYFAAHAGEIAILRDLDGCVFSAVCGFVKPDRAIYQHLCDTYQLLPQETLFVDDRVENVAAAEALGIRGYVFDGDAYALENHLDALHAFDGFTTD